MVGDRPRSVRLRERDGKLSILIVNNREEAVNVDISIENFDKKQPFNLYQVTENLVKAAGFKLNPMIRFKNAGKLKNIQFLPESISVITTSALKNENIGVIE